ncbi:MAG: MBL fold metallo-hydrolase [Candidatus Micrarchaeia archaeon]
MFEDLHWIGHASFYIEYKDFVVYIDPFRVPDKISKENKADLILITHAHFDHFSKPDIDKIKKGSTLIITSTQTLKEDDKVMIATPGFRYSFEGIDIEAVAAYNTKKERLNFHPKSNKWVGYVLKTSEYTLYHAGDTDFINEMKALKGIDLSLLPAGGTYTMDIYEAIEAANTIDTKYAAPIHYKNLLGMDGSKKAEETFKEKVSKALILKEVQEPTYSF